MPLNRVGTLGTAPFRINNTDTPQPASFPNEHYGGYHTYDFWNDGTEFSVCGIRRHHRAWNMLAYAGDKGITYKLIKGYKTLDIMDNANWKVWRIESEDTAINKGGLSLWQVEDKPYATEDFIVHDSKIWLSTIDDNHFTPGEIDPLTLEPVSAWRESSIDSLAHKRNKDEGGVRAGNVYISFQEIYDLILERVTKTQIDSNIALGESDTLIASQKAVKSYVDNLLNKALKSPKSFDASTATTFPTGVKGDTYRVTLPGEVQGVKLQAGDLFFTDKAAGAIAADWFVVQSNVDQATTEVLGLLRIATNAETIAEAVNDKAIVPSTLGAWWQNVLSRAGLYFSQVVSFFGINLGTDATTGNVRTIAAKGSENSVSVRIDVKGNGTVGSNALAHAGTDTLVAATIEGNFKNTGINPANIVESLALGNVRYVSLSGDDTKAKVGRIDLPYKTVQAAIQAATNGDIIYVFPGTYTENIGSDTLYKDITLFLHGAKIVGNVSSNQVLNILSDGTGHIVGQIYVNKLHIKNLYRLENTDTIIKHGYNLSSFIIDGVREIHQTAGSGVTFLNVTLANPCEIKNIGFIKTDTSNIFHAFRGKLENIGEINAVVGGIGVGNEDSIKARNVNFRSTNMNFALRNNPLVFHNCNFYSLSSQNFNDLWNSDLELNNCKLIANDAAYPTLNIRMTGPIVQRLSIRNCQWNKSAFYNPSIWTAIAKEDWANNEYNSDLTYNPL